MGYYEDTLVASGARTASSQTSTASGFGKATNLRAQLDVTVVSGTSPNLTVFVEDSLDGTNWNPVGTFAAKTATGREVINITTPFANRIRVRWAITGTNPSFTFSVIVCADVDR